MACPVEKLENEVEMKSSEDKIFQIFGKEAHKVPNMSPAYYQAVHVHEGDWETNGSVKQWHYTIDGKQEVFKEKTEVDEANKLLTFEGVGGHPMELYKSIKVTFHLVPKQDGNGRVVKIAMKSEKVKADVPPPNHYMNVVVNMIKDVDAHLLKA